MKLKRFFRKITAAVVSTALAAGMLTAGLSVSAAQSTPVGYITVNGAFAAAHADAIAAVAQGFRSFQNRVDVRQYGLSTEDIKLVFSSVMNMYPELFYVNYQFSYSYNSSGVTAIVPSYDYTAAQVNTMMAEFDEKSEYYLSKITPGMSDFDKALVLHDELILNSSYLLEGTTYTLMVNGTGKCEDYSRAYAFLLAQVGVKCEMILSPKYTQDDDGMQHQWVKVCIDGVYYHVDPTWDDPVAVDSYSYRNSGETRPNGYEGRVAHTYFLVSDSLINSTALGDAHTGYTTMFTSPATYDNAWFRNVNSRICCVDGSYYAVNTGSGNRTQLICCDTATGTPAAVMSRTFYWSAGGNYYYNGSFSGLDYCDGLFYFNGPNAVYTYDPVAGTVTEYAQNPSQDQIFGMRIFNRNVIAYTASSPGDLSEVWLLGHIDEPLPPLMLGDVNGDEVVDISDATLMQRAIAEYETIDARQQTAADFNADGTLSVGDVTLVQKQIAHITAA